jgi:hypothetical protein
MKSGMSVTMFGTIRVAIKAQKRVSRPQNRSLANAYAASIEKTT